MDTSPAVILFLGIANATFDDIMDCPLTEKRIAAFLSSALLKQKNLLQYLHFRPHDGAKEAMEDHLSQLLLELIRHDEAAPHICRGLLIRIFRCTEETREATLQKLQHMARTAYGAAPAFTVQLIVVSGILQWTYEAQVYVGEHAKKVCGKVALLCVMRTSPQTADLVPFFRAYACPALPLYPFCKASYSPNTAL